MEDLERQIRNAVSGGEFMRAQHLWSVYGETLHRRILSRQATETDLSRTAALVEWTRHSARCAQAMAMQDLNALAVQGCYRPERTRPKPLMSVTG